MAKPLGAPPLFNISKDPNRDNEAVTDFFMTMLGFYDNAEELYMVTQRPLIIGIDVLCTVDGIIKDTFYTDCRVLSLFSRNPTIRTI